MSNSDWINDRLIGITPAELDKPIYRIMKIEHLLALFEQRENVLVSPKVWDDPYENFLLKNPQQLDSGQLDQHPFADLFFGQCWTERKSECDALWRIYSPYKTGVRVRTTIKKLIKSLCESRSEQEWGEHCAFIGRVHYKKKDKLHGLARTRYRSIDNPENQDWAIGFLLKPKMFRYEKEIRLVFLGPDSSRDQDVIRYRVDPGMLIEEVLVDPRWDPNSVDGVIAALKRSTGLNNIRQSELYGPPFPAVTDQRLRA